MLPVDLERIAGVVAVHRKGRDQHRAVHPDSVHRGHHVVARDLRRAGQDAGPGATRMVAFIGVHLRIYDHHDATSHEYGFLPALSSMLCTVDLGVCAKNSIVGWRHLPIRRTKSPKAEFLGGLSLESTAL